MIFSYALKNGGIKKSELNEDTSIEFAALSGSYISGIGDFVNLFEPNASKLESEGYGCVLASLGEYVGDIPYTVFNTKLDYYEKNIDIINKFRKAINKGIEFTLNNDEETLAKVLATSFPDESINNLKTMIKRYKDSNAWWNDTNINEEAWNKLESVMEYNEVIKGKNYYKKLVRND